MSYQINLFSHRDVEKGKNLQQPTKSPKMLLHRATYISITQSCTHVRLIRSMVMQINLNYSMSAEIWRQKKKQTTIQATTIRLILPR